MTRHKIRSFLIPLFTFCIIIAISSAIIAFGRGYRLNLKKPTELLPTGLISATSDPVGAQVLINGVLKTATNNSLSIDPAWYTVQIRKEGFIPWEKKLRVQGEVVARADAFLFPTSPSLSPITISGVLSPTLSPDGTMIAFLLPPEAITDGIKKPGLYTLELADRPLSGRNRDPKLIVELPTTFPFTKASILWSPDGRQIIVSAGTNATLYDLSFTPPTSTPISPISLIALMNDWRSEQTARDRQKLSAFKQPFIDVATTSARLLSFSPDETKLLYEATQSATIPLVINPPLLGSNTTEEERTIKPGNLYVYDSREDKNYFIEVNKSVSSPLQWFPTSKHILLVGKGKIDVMEYDRTNWTTLYSGPFNESFVTPWPTGSRIVILTNLNPGAGSLPNLYTVNLR
ncbi:MAG: PEGA domain-containing protein [Patescibacteria group bacterium]